MKLDKFAKWVMGICALVAIAVIGLTAEAQTYPYTTPSYIPNAGPVTTTASAPTTIPFNISGVGTVSLRVSGTCTSLAATFQASNDGGANYTAINLYPIATGTSAPTAVASISAAGFWKANTSGYNLVRLNISALSATCTVTMVGHPGGFNGTTF